MILFIGLIITSIAVGLIFSPEIGLLTLGICLMVIGIGSWYDGSFDGPIEDLIEE